MRLTVRILTIALVLVGLGTVAGWILTAMRGAPPAPGVLTFLASPDGAYKAALANWNGGGAIAPYCYDSVYVVPQTLPDDRVVDDDHLVFSSACGSFRSENGDFANSPQLSWRGPKVLVVRFSTSPATGRAETFQLRRLVAGGQVSVEFEVGH